jgi:hypothetical protein
MKFKHVRLMVLSVLFVAILFAIPVFVANIHVNMTLGNLNRRTTIQSHAGAILLGDPVGGGIPQAQPNGT